MIETYGHIIPIAVGALFLAAVMIHGWIKDRRP